MEKTKILQGDYTLAQSVLAAIAHNINRLHWRIQSGKTEIKLYELKKTACYFDRLK